MADDPWDRYENPGNVDPWAGFADAPQPRRRITLVPVDHDPFADGGDLSSVAARRLPAERAVPPRGTSLQGLGEDEEARAWAPRGKPPAFPRLVWDMITRDQPRAPDDYLAPEVPHSKTDIGAAALIASVPRMAREGAEAVGRLSARAIEGIGYQPGIRDEQAVADALAGASLASGGAIPFARPSGSLGTFIGRVGAKNLAEAGHPTALRAIAEAERLETTAKLPQDVIRLEVNKLIRAEDPSLGGVWRGDDGLWRVEISDKDARVRQAGPFISKLGREYTHPELYQAYHAGRELSANP